MPFQIVAVTEKGDGLWGGGGTEELEDCLEEEEVCKQHIYADLLNQGNKFERFWLVCLCSRADNCNWPEVWCPLCLARSSEICLLSNSRQLCTWCEGEQQPNSLTTFADSLLIFKPLTVSRMEGLPFLPGNSFRDPTVSSKPQFSVVVYRRWCLALCSK